jgi:hypothetical protein
MQLRRPDEFFTAEQINRLADLMAKWRRCRDEGKSLSDAEELQLRALVDAELEGATARAARMLELKNG